VVQDRISHFLHSLILPIVVKDLPIGAHEVDENGVVHQIVLTGVLLVELR